jgi:hypothetical protein
VIRPAKIKEVADFSFIDRARKAWVNEVEAVGAARNKT